MRSSLMERCVAQVRNEELLRKGHWLEHEHIVKLGAMMFANAGLEANAETLKECKRILKGKAGLFSNFRGTMEYLVQVKMALADDPEAYIDGVLHVYEQLKSGRLLPGESIAMAATTIYENCRPNSSTRWCRRRSMRTRWSRSSTASSLARTTWR